ncbi:MAG TPA: hypothetical protein ENK43_17750 [Planctomycetes bacterium]|nr:hypothetical protein [Planctomycetota bacterium]
MSAPTPQVLAVDNGVWLSGLIYGGPAEELIQLGVTGGVRLVTTQSMIDSMVRILRERLGFSEAALEQVVQFIRECAEVLEDTVPPDGDAASTLRPAAGPGEYAVLDAADRGEASAIAVAGPSPLQQMPTWQGIPIVPLA